MESGAPQRKRSKRCHQMGVTVFRIYLLLHVGLTGSLSENLKTHACENEVLLLECPRAEILRISHAVFGRFSLSLCNPDGDTMMSDLTCRSDSSTPVVANKCDGRQTCEIKASVEMFEEPCPEMSKYLEVYYKCEPEVTAPPHQPHPDLSTLDETQLPRYKYDGSPEAPELRSSRPVNATAVEIVWEVKDVRPIKFMKLYYTNLVRDRMHVPRIAEFKTRDLPTRFGVSREVIGGLLPSTRYLIFLKSTNNRGVGPDSNNLTFITPALERIPSTTTTRKPGGRDLFLGLSKPDKISLPTTTSLPSIRTSTMEEPEVPTDHRRPPYIDNGAGRDRDSTNTGLEIQMCSVVEFQGVMWPLTRSGQVAEEACPRDMAGLSSWRCVGTTWASSGPDLSDCISPWLSALDKQVTRVMEGDEEPMTAMKALQHGIKKRGNRLLPGDLKRVAYKMLPKLARRMLAKREKHPEDIQEFQEAIVWTSSQLLAESHQASWGELSVRDRRRAATSLVNQLERTGFEVADNLAVGYSSVAADRNIVVKASRVDTQVHHSDLTFPSPGDLDSSSAWKERGDSITISSTSLKTAGRTDPLSVVFTMYNNLEDLMEPQQSQVSTTSSTDDGQPSYDAESSSNSINSRGAVRDDVYADNEADSVEPVMVVNSRIIAASMGSSRLKRLLPEPVRFTLKHLHPRDNSRPLCSFWEIDTTLLSGHWSQEGCRMIYGNRSHTMCECDHLTNFAVLMDVTGVELPEEHELALRVITYVGCIISIICLLLAWITFTIFKNLQCDRNTIHKNLVLTLLLAEVLFVGGIAQTHPKILCAVVAGGLHYLFLCAFAWMCLEGVQLYVMLVQVFEHERSRVNSYYLFGYGVPLVVVAVSAAVYHQGYGTDRHCWLTTDHYFVMSFVGPACAVMLINVAMLGIAIYTMCRHSNMSATMKERSKVNKFSAWLKGAVVLVVLLGLTWAFGLLYLNQQTVAWAYVFTVLNSLQGLFIFVFHCLKNDKVQKEYRKVARHTSWLPNCIRVNYGGYNLRASSSRPNSSGSGNYLSKLFGAKRKSAASTNSSAKPFLSTDQQRKSDVDNSGSRCSANCESASIPPPSPHPTLLNGYVYNPSYAHLNGYTLTSISNGTGDGGLVVAPHTNNGCSQHHMHQLAPCYEEVVGELSQVLDCSMVDSEMVTEYCQNNLQVNQEKPRYSTGSEDSVRLLPTLPPQPPPFLDPDNLSTVSMASSSVVHGSTQALPSSGSFPSEQHTGGEGEVEPLYEEVKTWPHDVQGNSDPRQAESEAFDPSLNLRQYIIPNSKQINTSVRREDGRDLRVDNQQPEVEEEDSPSTMGLHFYPGISEPAVTSRKDSNSAAQLSSSNPISFTHPLAASNFKPDKANGVSQPAEAGPVSKNHAKSGSQPCIPSKGPGKLVVTCAGPTGLSNCRARCDPQLGPTQSSSDC